MNIQKQGTAQCAGMPTEQQMAKINELAKTPLQAQEVYVFSVRLCDDLPDRDFERFDTQALGVLAEMFVGKTGIIDHEWSSNNQIARIFETYVEKDGEVSFITAWAYMLRNAATQPMIDDIEGGIRKEVSVGCAMQRAVCSICGREYGTCEHRKGQQYDQEICVAVLCQPTDAYEFSFVAVPAQRYAGVQKQWKGRWETHPYTFR